MYIEEMLREPETHREPLTELRDKINKSRGHMSECSRCGRKLVVPQQLAYVDLVEGKVCKICLERIPR